MSRYKWYLTPDKTGYVIVKMTRCDEDYLHIPREHNGKPVVAIGIGAFCGNAKIRQVCVPETICSIGKGAFYGCTSLERVQYYGDVPIIREHTFANCVNLKSITVIRKPYITENAFVGCRNVMLTALGDCINEWVA